MKKTLAAAATPSEFDADALFNKAQRYIQQMEDLSSDDWEYALWSSLALELLARASLANVSPALLADADKNWSSLHYSLGFTPNEERFSPRSISITEVFKRLNSIFPKFAREFESFAIQHTGKRNSELHSGALAFEGVKASAWQPKFYETCEVLLASMDKKLEDFIGDVEAKVAKEMIAASADNSAKAIKGDVEAHKKVWVAKSKDEREKLSKQAEIWATRQSGHRVVCPACASKALVVGEPVSGPLQKLADGQITETQEFLPNRFECIACGLKVSGLSRLGVIGLSDKYKKTQIYDAAEYYAPQDEHEGFEDDNNEY